MNTLFELIKENNNFDEIENFINLHPEYLYFTGKHKIEEYKEQFGYIEYFKNITLEKCALYYDKIDIYNFLIKKKKEIYRNRRKKKRMRSLSPCCCNNKERSRSRDKY